MALKPCSWTKSRIPFMLLSFNPPKVLAGPSMPHQLMPLMVNLFPLDIK